MRRSLLPLGLMLALAACQQASPPNATAPAAPTDFIYAELDIADLQARMQAGELDSRRLTQAYLDRIAAVDKAGPQLNAVIELNPDALKEAALRDVERRANAVRGPLHGIPVLLKDNIDAVPLATSAGSLALKDFRPGRDAFLVRRLREAGAVILGAITGVSTTQGDETCAFIGNEIVTSHPCDDQSNAYWAWNLLTPVPPELDRVIWDGSFMEAASGTDGPGSRWHGHAGTSSWGEGAPWRRVEQDNDGNGHLVRICRPRAWSGWR